MLVPLGGFERPLSGFERALTTVSEYDSHALALAPAQPRVTLTDAPPELTRMMIIPLTTIQGAQSR